LLSLLVIACTAVDITVENVDNHSPFSEETVNGARAYRVFTKEELSEYNGENPGLPIYVSVKGIVFDVSDSRKVYGPGGNYNVFTGKDASRAIAKWSMSEEDLNDNLDDLSQEELARLDDIYNKLYLSKYPKVGYLEGHEPQDEDNLTVKKNINIEL